MKLLFDFLPIVLFFISYKLYGIYIATIVIIIASLLQTGIFWLKHRKIEFTHAITLVLVSVLGIATILLHNEMFIKWKPTAIYWLFALLFLGSEFIGTKTLLERLMDNKVNLPKAIWQKLNFAWIVFFIVMGAINIYVAYNFNTDIWVNFKLFGALGGTLIFGILQSLYMAKYLKNAEE